MEVAVRAFLRDHLPSRLSVGHGQIIDQYDGYSGQLDVIITDEDQPFHYAPDKHGLYVVEGVAAVCEVKSLLTTGSLADAIRTCTRSKSLHYSHSEGDTINTAPANKDRYYVSPPTFVVALESNVATGTLLSSSTSTTPSGPPTATPSKAPGLATPA